MADVLKVIVSDDCYETCPCQHDVTVYYKDGRVENTCMFGDEIIERFSEFISEEQREHLTDEN